MLTGLDKQFSSSTQRSNSVLSTHWLNVLAFVTFFVYALVLLGLQNHSPMELYDESRNANNAIEMAHNGHWFVSYYDGAPDHWNTKPLLLIWMIAGLIKLGVPAMTALRLPSTLAALLTVVLIYLFCRILIRNTTAAVWSGLILMSCILFFGPHMAMNGDYDALLCFFTTLYCLAFWVFVENIEGQAGIGLFVTGIALTLAILTKGIAGALPLPGFFLYVLLRKRLGVVVRDRRFWLALLAAGLVIAGYYKGRDIIDPGYIKAVWQNELSGRYMAVNEGHRRKALFFARVLVDNFKPGVYFLPLGCLFLLRPSSRSSRAYSSSVLCAAISLVLLLVLSKSQTKIWYYCGPAIPLLAIFGAIGAAELPDTLQRLSNRAFISFAKAWAVALTAGLVLSSAWALYQDEDLKHVDLSAREKDLIPQEQYGVVLESMERSDISGPVLLIDDGVQNSAKFPHYNPIGSFYAKLATERGMQVQLRTPEDQIGSNTWVATCDPKSIAWLLHEHPLKDSRTAGGCLYGETVR